MLITIIILGLIVWALCAFIVYLEMAAEASVARAFGWGGYRNFEVLLAVIFAPALVAFWLGAILIDIAWGWLKR